MASTLNGSAHLANTTSQVAYNPAFKHQIKAGLPRWINDLYFLNNPRQRPKDRPFDPRIRSATCKDWIKVDNHIPPADGIRKRTLTKATPHKNAMARPLGQAHYERHMIHLMSSLLSLRTNSSPFTLVLDDLNQRAAPLTNDLLVRALSRNLNIVIVSYEGVHYQQGIRTVPAYSLDAAGTLRGIEAAMQDSKESLVLIDSLHTAVTTQQLDIKALFHLVVVKFASTLIGIYHTDMLPPPSAQDAYAPPALDLLKFMATSIITCRSFAHVLAAKAAAERALPTPTHGLLHAAEGVVQCLRGNDIRGVVLEVEFRRKSGRPERETFFLRRGRRSDYHAPSDEDLQFGVLKAEYVVLLAKVPQYASKAVTGMVGAAAVDEDMSFNLGLTDKQRVKRSEVVLPYTDAQKEEGGEGGRILYDMGEEDDFDEEEDEI